MPNWLLPEHIADVLPSEARKIEELRRALLDKFRLYGYELVMPPLLEHLESLLSGTGEALDLQTFKLVDQLSGRMMGLRADSTPQVARIDAHLLNRRGVARLCYCGPVLHTRPGGPHASREPLQFGAEIYGHAGLEADLEIEATVAAAEATWAKGTTTEQAKPRTRENSKQAEVIRMLQRPEGATIGQICTATGWQAHTVRGTFAGAFKKKLGLNIVSDKPKGGERIYRIA